nr:MAG TPA: protein of unknown function (DUF4373) [Caudoviricetes sp.]
MELFLKLDERLLRDDKIRDLIRSDGYEGLGIYLSLLTLFRNYKDHAYQIPLDKIPEIASWDLHIDPDRLMALIERCAEIGLFRKSEETFWSPRRKSDLLKAEELRKKQSEGGLRAMEKRWKA